MRTLDCSVGNGGRHCSDGAGRVDGFGGVDGVDGVDGGLRWRRWMASMASMVGVNGGDWGLRHRGQ